MTPFGRALWHIATHFNEEFTLDGVAQIAVVSRFHLTRAFGLGADMPLVKYRRGRRLTEAARALARGAPDILALALEAGYGSHEAFTRAFKDHFGLTPEAVRAQGHVQHLNLVQPIRMDETLLTTLDLPRFEDGRAPLLAGLVERYAVEASAAIRSSIVDRASLALIRNKFGPKQSISPDWLMRVALPSHHSRIAMTLTNKRSMSSWRRLKKHVRLIRQVFFLKFDRPTTSRA